MIEKDARIEVERIVNCGEKEALRLRTLGGLAIFITCPSARAHPGLKRAYADIDLVGLGKDGPRLGQLFTGLGYSPDQRFNALHGLQRMIFYNPEDNSHVDVFLDRFQMCHTLDLRARLLEGYLTLPLADLLLTKLQIFELNEKDMKDILAILLDHALGEESPDHLNSEYLARLTGQNWGLYTSISDNLQRVKAQAADFLEARETVLVTERVGELLKKMAAAPKSLKWQARARIGRRMEWYDLPDEVNR
jgi:hypothetical protein